jgi:FtsP/CotA-like multicopper oxidase with cupredoxin domain
LWNPEGKGGPPLPVDAFAEEGAPPQNPGPLIRTTVGTKVRVSIRNRLLAAVTLHGLDAHTSAPPPPLTIPPLATREVDFHAAAPGVFLYWASAAGAALDHRDAVDSQLSGALVIDPPGPPPQDRIFVLDHWSIPGDPKATTTASPAGAATAARLLRRSVPARPSSPGSLRPDPAPSSITPYAQLSPGLYGALVVIDPGSRFDPETDKIFVLSRGGPDDDKDAFLINGSDSPPPLQLAPHRRYRLRFIGITPAPDLQIALQKGGRILTGKALAKDGPALASACPREPARIDIFPGETYEFEFVSPAAGDLQLVAVQPFFKLKTVAPIVVARR